MTIEEKRDMLLEFYGQLWRIKTFNKEENPELEYQLIMLEKRLSVLGVTDLSDIKHKDERTVQK